MIPGYVFERVSVRDTGAERQQGVGEEQQQSEASIGT